MGDDGMTTAVVVCVMLFLVVICGALYFFCIDNFTPLPPQKNPADTPQSKIMDTVHTLKHTTWIRKGRGDPFFMRSVDELMMQYPHMMKRVGIVAPERDEDDEEMKSGPPSVTLPKGGNQERGRIVDEEEGELVLVSSWTGHEEELTKEMNATVTSMRVQLGREPTLDELGQALGWSGMLLVHDRPRRLL